MGDQNCMVSELEDEENLIAAAQQIVKALGSKKSLSNHTKKLLADLSIQLSTMTANDGDDNDEGVSLIEEQLSVVQDKIMSWEANQSTMWDSSPEEVSDYLNAVSEVQRLIERLESLSFSRDCEENEILRGAYDVLQVAMARLEEEFRNMLVQNGQPFEHENRSFRSSEDYAVDGSSIVSSLDDSFEDLVLKESVSGGSEEFMVDLVNPDMIPNLRYIADLMFFSNYNHECIQAYTSVRKDALDECLDTLEIVKLSIEDVLKMPWGSLNAKIKRWIRAMKIFVRVYLPNEKLLCDQIFGERGSVNLVCVFDASKSAIFQLLNFCEAISIGPHQPEKLFCILDMYEVMVDVLPDINTLFSDDAGSSIRIEWDEVLRRLGDSARSTFLKFEYAVASNTSTNPFAGGGIHPLTKYVMNYIRILTDYSETLNFLLRDNHNREHSKSPSPDTSPPTEDENRSECSLCISSPVAPHFQSIASALESNLVDKAKLYKDASLQHLFWMNNIHYMAQKVKNEELRVYFGDKWIKKHNWNFQHHAMEYERATWMSILNLLKDEGIQNSGSSSISKSLLKERFRSFYLALEEVYKTQTAWLIPDHQLREELQISISLKVIQAYRTFLGRFANHVSDQHIKYSADDLENYLLDLFEGSPKSLQNPHRR